jgi:hypothetical protein
MQQRAKQQGIKLSSAPSRQKLQAQEKDRQRERDQIYGYELLSQQELEQYRDRMRQAKTAQERKEIQSQHQKEIQERARQAGITLQPPAKL